MKKNCPLFKIIGFFFGVILVGIVVISALYKKGYDEVSLVCEQARLSMKFEEFQAKLPDFGIKGTDKPQVSQFGTNQIKYGYMPAIIMPDGSLCVVTVDKESGLIIKKEVYQ